MTLSRALVLGHRDNTPIRHHGVLVSIKTISGTPSFPALRSQGWWEVKFMQYAAVSPGEPVWLGLVEGTALGTCVAGIDGGHSSGA